MESATQETQEQSYDCIIQDGKIYLRCSDEQGKKVQRLPRATYRKKWECFEFPADAACASNVLELLPELIAHPDVHSLASSHHSLSLSGAVAKSLEEPEQPPSRTPSWKHQARAFWFLRALGKGALFMEMGTGKSKVLVDVICAEEYKLTLIVCPKAVIQTWVDEFAKHAIDAIQVVPLEGSALERQSYFEAGMRMAKSGTRVVFVINYESVWRNPLGELFERAKLDAVVLDESQKIKAAGSRVSLYFLKLGQKVKHRYILTGTPMAESPLDIYGQYRFLEPGIFGTNFENFKKRYAQMDEYSPYTIAEYINQEDLAERMYQVAYRVLSDDVLSLPDVVHIERFCDLSPKARKIYNELKREMTVEVEGDHVTTDTVLTKLLRLQQLTSGLAKLDNGSEEVVDEAKRNLLLDTVEDIPKSEPLVIFAYFTHEINFSVEVCKKLERKVGILSGLRNDLKDFQDGKYDTLVVQIKSGGAGVNLTRSHTVIYVSTGNSLGDYAQSLKRTHRPGQEHRVKYIHLLARRTMDGVIQKALEKKADIVSLVVDRLRQ